MINSSFIFIGLSSVLVDTAGGDILDISGLQTHSHNLKFVDLLLIYC